MRTRTLIEARMVVRRRSRPAPRSDDGSPTPTGAPGSPPSDAHITTTAIHSVSVTPIASDTGPDERHPERHQDERAERVVRRDPRLGALRDLPLEHGEPERQVHGDADARDEGCTPRSPTTGAPSASASELAATSGTAAQHAGDAAAGVAGCASRRRSPSDGADAAGGEDRPPRRRRRRGRSSAIAGPRTVHPRQSHRFADPEQRRPTPTATCGR